MVRPCSNKYQPSIVEIPDPQDIDLIRHIVAQARLRSPPPSLTQRITNTAHDTLVRGLSYFVTANFLSPNRLLQAIVYNVTPTACLNRIFSLSPNCCSSLQVLLQAMQEFCHEKTVLDVFTTEKAVKMVTSMFTTHGFKAAVICDALWHGIFGCLVGKKNTMHDLLTTITSSLLIFLFAANVLSHSADDKNVTDSMKKSYATNDLELIFVTNAAWNLGTFAVYKGLHHFCDTLLGLIFK